MSGAQGVFGGERSLGLMDFAVEEGKKPPSLHTLSMCYKATGAAGQGRTAWKGIHHPNSHSALRQSCQQLVTNTPLCSLTRRTSHPHTLHCLQKFPPKQTQTFREQQRSCWSWGLTASWGFSSSSLFPSLCTMALNMGSPFCPNPPESSDPFHLRSF